MYVDFGVQIVNFKMANFVQMFDAIEIQDAQLNDGEKWLSLRNLLKF